MRWTKKLISVLYVEWLCGWLASCDPCVVIISNAYLKLYAEQVSKQAKEKNNYYCKLHCGIYFGKAKSISKGIVTQIVSRFSCHEIFRFF